MRVRRRLYIIFHGRDVEITRRFISCHVMVGFTRKFISFHVMVGFNRRFIGCHGVVRSGLPDGL